MSSPLSILKRMNKTFKEKKKEFCNPTLPLTSFILINSVFIEIIKHLAICGSFGGKKSSSLYNTYQAICYDYSDIQPLKTLKLYKRYNQRKSSMNLRHNTHAQNTLR